MVKIGIIGAGSVGGAIASRIVADNLGRELVLIDTDAPRVRAAALDLSHAAAFGRGMKITAGKYENLGDADIVIISAGANQKTGQSRTELVERNAMVMLDVVPKIMSAADRKKIILIVVSNPLDSMVMAAQKISNLPAGRVIGTGTMLDTARLRHELSRRFNVSASAVDAYVLGEHGDSSVVNWTSARIGGLPPEVADKRKREIEKRVRGAAMDIILGRGATWDGIAAAAADLVRCIANDERRILPVSIVDRRVAYSMPRIVGAGGVSATIMPAMDGSERAALRASIDAIKKNYEIVK
ncbi:MAG: NAD(P)-binding domain-containing protein [Rickettsiales bacterium]|jgi:L-lactate dehydrogenase|nr:NAD(P)-binding domain-containing protein [Rickettsiales bacterium]